MEARYLAKGRLAVLAVHSSFVLLALVAGHSDLSLQTNESVNLSIYA
jgi:hypothetical protein